MPSKVLGSIESDIQQLNSSLPIQESVDISGKDMVIAGNKGYLVYMSSMINMEMLARIVIIINQLEKQETRKSDILTLLEQKLSFVNIVGRDDIADISKEVLAGQVLLLVDGFSQGILIDARLYPTRAIVEPATEKETRGAHDGFIETMIVNLTLIRRRVRHTGLLFEAMSVGTESPTDCAIGYINGKADADLVETVKNRISSARIASLPMATKSLQEIIFPSKWFNPFPTVRFTERPDVVAAQLLEGNIIIVTDTSPSVMILPATLLSFFEKPEDYNQTTLAATLFHLTNILAFLVSVFMVPLVLLSLHHIDQLPEILREFLKDLKDSTPHAILVQILILEVGLELLKKASFQNPAYLTTALSLVGAIIVGDILTKSGNIQPVIILIIGVMAISMYSLPNMEVAIALRLCRLFLTILTGVFGAWGLAAGAVLLFLIAFTTNKGLSSTRYTWPVIPFSLKGISKMLTRRNVR